MEMLRKQLPVCSKYKLCCLELPGASPHPSIFYPWLVRSVDVEPADVEGPAVLLLLSFPLCREGTEAQKD